MAFKAGDAGRRPARGVPAYARRGHARSEGAAPVLVSADDLAAFVEGLTQGEGGDGALEVAALKSRADDLLARLKASRAEFAAQRAVVMSLDGALAAAGAENARLSAALADKETQWAAASAALKEVQPALDEAAANAALLDGSYLWKLLRPLVRLEVHGRGLVRKVSRRRRRLAEDAAEVAATSLFDRTWYLDRYPDVGASRIDPLHHYLLHGAREGRDPGPSFSSAAYLQAYPDVVAAELNPLLHYARYGRAEGRAVFPADLIGAVAVAPVVTAPPSGEEEELALLRASEYFDAAWYLSRNPDVAALGADPAQHFLLFGGLEGRDPGPRFSSSAYLAENVDVAQARLNPLLHYLQFGISEGRALTLVQVGEPALPAPRLMARPFESPLSPSACLPREAFPCGKEDVTFGAGNIPLAFAASGAAAAEALVVHLRLLRQISSPDDRGLFWTQGKDQYRQAMDEAAYRGAGGAIRVLEFPSPDAPAISDASLQEGHTLRLRLVGAPGNPQVVSVLQFGARGIELLGECTVTGEAPAFADIPILDGFHPLLIVSTDAHGRLRGSCLLPFPCLLRGGSHHGEALASEPASSGLDQVRALSARLLAGWAENGFGAAIDSIEVDLNGGTGAERIFDHSLRAWLADGLRISIRGIPDATQNHSDGAHWLAEAVMLVPSSPRGSASRGTSLRLPVDAVPALQALLLGCATTESGFAPFIAAREEDGTASWLVVPPAVAAPLDAYQPSGVAPFPRLAGGLSRDTRPRKGETSPAAIRLFNSSRRQGAEWVAPFAPEMPVDFLVGAAVAPSRSPPRVSVVLPLGQSPERTGAVLESLALQHGVRSIQVIGMTSCDAPPVILPVLRRHFPETGHLVLCGPDAPAHARLNEAVALAESELLLILGEDVLLHDARTLAVLSALLEQPQVASVGCPLIATTAKKAVERVQVLEAGRFPAPRPEGNVQPLAKPLFSLFASLPPAVWPMAAPSRELFVVHRSAWVRHGGFQPGIGVEAGAMTTFWEDTAREGQLHLTTFAVSASMMAPQKGALAQGASDQVGHSAGHPSSLTARRIVA